MAHRGPPEFRRKRDGKSQAITIKITLKSHQNPSELGSQQVCEHILSFESSNAVPSTKNWQLSHATL